MFNFPIAQLFHLCILGWHDANSDFRRLAQVRSIKRNRRNRPTPQSLLGLLAQTLEEPIFHHIPPSATLQFIIGPGVALPYSTTSSASASSVFGTLSPIAFAVFRLSTNRKRVGCSTGRSAGLVPLKMRSTRAAERSKISRRSGPYDIKPPSRVSESVS